MKKILLLTVVLALIGGGVWFFIYKTPRTVVPDNPGYNKDGSVRPLTEEELKKVNESLSGTTGGTEVAPVDQKIIDSLSSGSGKSASSTSKSNTGTSGNSEITPEMQKAIDSLSGKSN